MSRFEKYAGITCTHGILIDPSTEKVFLSHLKDFKPTFKIHLGDWSDLVGLRQGATMKDLLEDPDPDIERGEHFLDKAKFDIILEGNHDARARIVMGKAMEWDKKKAARDVYHKMREIVLRHADRYILRDSLHGYYVYGDRTFLHGFHHGENMLAKHSQEFCGPVTVGHTHTKRELALRTIRGGTSYNVGCAMMIEQARYAETWTSRQQWRNCFFYGVKDKRTGKTSQWTATKEGGHWVIPSDIKVI